MDTVRVLVVDDYDAFRCQLCNLFELEDGIKVVGDAADGEEAVVKTGSMLPDVVLMDLSMPKRGGLEATKLIKEQHPEINVIILTVSDEEHLKSKAREVGASAYLLKDISFDKLAEKIRLLTSKAKNGTA